MLKGQGGGRKRCGEGTRMEKDGGVEGTRMEKDGS